MTQPSIYLIATLDTKGEELAFVARAIQKQGVDVTTVDVGTGTTAIVPGDVSRDVVAGHHECGANHVLRNTERGSAVTAMSEALVRFLVQEHARGKVAGVIGLGGSCGTALIAPAMRALPIGLPKLLVSTVASGNTAEYVGGCDITLMPSVVDVCGINRVSRQVLSNAAHAIAAMVRCRTISDDEKPTVAMTMFGVTTPCVTVARNTLEATGNDVLVFHATGTGGRAMEKLVESGLVSGVIDATTTEVADEVVGGIFPAGPARFDAILASRIPYVLSLGALDMVNFAGRETVPERFRDRRLHVHNAQITLMRTSVDENREIARWIATKLNRSTAPLILLVPEGGVSALDAPGLPFWDPAADHALFETLESLIHQTPQRQVRRLALHINDPAFSEALVDAYHELL